MLQFPHEVGFLQEYRGIGPLEFLQNLLCTVSAAQDDGYIRSQAAHALEGLVAVHAGHGEVHEHQVEALPVCLELIQGIQAICSRDDGETERLEDGGGGFQDRS